LDQSKLAPPALAANEYPPRLADHGVQQLLAESIPSIVHLPRFPLNGIRVPVKNDTIEGAKSALAADLAAQMRLLLLLSSSAQEGKLAPQLRENLTLLSRFLEPRRRA